MSGKVKQFADASMEKIASMEKRLSGVLRPVKPRKEFVHGVARRIKTKPNEAFFAQRFTQWHIVAVIIAGMISLAVFLAVTAKALTSLWGKKRTA
jgi:hypothetical protein